MVVFANFQKYRPCPRYAGGPHDLMYIWFHGTGWILGTWNLPGPESGVLEWVFQGCFGLALEVVLRTHHKTYTKWGLKVIAPVPQGVSVDFNMISPNQQPSKTDFAPMSIVYVSTILWAWMLFWVEYAWRTRTDYLQNWGKQVSHCVWFGQKSSTPHTPYLVQIRSAYIEWMW